MTTDDFTTAAREESERMWPGVGRGQSRADLDRAMRGGFQVGAEWARDHLAAQEPTDAEVEAAAVVIWESYDLLDRAAIRDALTAARAVGRDAR